MVLCQLFSKFNILRILNSHRNTFTQFIINFLQNDQTQCRVTQHMITPGVMYQHFGQLTKVSGYKGNKVARHKGISVRQDNNSFLLGSHIWDTECYTGNKLIHLRIP